MAWKPVMGGTKDFTPANPSQALLEKRNLPDHCRYLPNCLTEGGIVRGYVSALIPNAFLQRSP
jgi:hypothetical protein